LFVKQDRKSASLEEINRHDANYWVAVRVAKTPNMGRFLQNLTLEFVIVWECKSD